MAAFSKAVVSLDAAEFSAVTDVNPVELLPAPGAGKYIAVRAFDVIMLKATRVWETRGNPVLLLGSEASAVAALSLVLSGGANNADESTVGVGSAAAGSSGVAWIFGAVQAENQPLAFGITGGDTVNGGPIVAASVADGGSGYAPGDTGTIYDPTLFAYDGTYTVDTVDGGGAVLTFTVTDPGTAYGVLTFPTSFTSGGGSGFTIDVTSVAPGDSPVKFIIYYTIEDL